MNQQQRKHLNEMIAAAQRAIRIRIYRAETVKPAKVKKAEAIIAAWERKVRNARDTYLYDAENKLFNSDMSTTVLK